MSSTGEPQPPPELLATIANLSQFHREHERFYSRAPLQQAIDVQLISRTLKALAGHWATAVASAPEAGSPFAGAEDLNPPGLVAEGGVLFMEGEGEPAEIARMRRDLEQLADDVEETGRWLAAAMEGSWQTAGALAAFPDLADLLGERHRIIANDWQSASIQPLIGRLLRRAVELVESLDLTPAAVRADLEGDRASVAYLNSASELLDRAADLLAESAMLVHDNERRWRVFGERVARLQAEAEQG
jgi:hypothetical protein